MNIKENLTNVNYWVGNGAGGTKKNEYIVIHYVGAVSSAYDNSVYFKNTNRGASANYFVDEVNIYRVVKDTDSAWHCGASKYYCGARNTNSIGIEMCCFMNNGKLDVSEKVVANTIELTKELMKKYNIPADNVVRHYDVTRKNCPAPFVANPIRWDNFKAKLTTKPTSNNTTTKACKVELPKNAESWRVYPMDKAPTVGNECGFLKPSKFGGLTYDVLDWTQTDVAVIETRDFGRVQIYVAASTGAKVTNKTTTTKKPATTKKQKLYLPKEAETWRVYPLNKKPTVGNECGFLKPSKFGGLTYDIIKFTQTDVAVIETRDFGQVQIYVAASTGAVIK